MSIEINDGAVRVSVTYSLKVPTPVEYAAEQASLSMSLEMPANGDFDAVMKEAEQMEKALYRNVQLGVFEMVGVTEWEETAYGRLVPKLPEFERKKKTSGGRKSSGSKKPSSSGSSRKADPSQIPTVTIVLDGKSVQVQDLRDLKGKVYADTAPDFRIGSEGIWLKNKDGSDNERGLAILAAIDAAAPFESNTSDDDDW